MANNVNLEAMFMFIARMLFVVIIISSSFITSADVYKWTDKDGKIHYSDKPRDEKSQQIKMKKEPTATEILQAKEKASSLIKSTQLKIEQDQEEQQKLKYSKQQAEQKINTLKKECEQAKTAARVLGQRRVSYTQDKQGEKHYLSDEEKIQKISELKGLIKEFCGE